MQQIPPAKSLSKAVLGLLLLFSTFSLPSLANDLYQVRQGLPGRRISGGVRLDPAGSCLSSADQSLVAMIPRNNLGKTANEHPTFWLSIPETTGQKIGEFQIFDESEKMIYATQIDIGDSYGLSEFQLPKSAPALAVNTNYRWVFSVACGKEPSSSENRVSESLLGIQGWVRRIELSNDVISQLTMASPIDRVPIYATAGLWHEQVTEIVNLRRQDIANMDVQIEWSSLVDSNGLTNYVSSNISNTMTATEIVAEAAITTELSTSL